MVSFEELNFVTDKYFSSSLLMCVLVESFLRFLIFSPQLIRNTLIASLSWVKKLRLKGDFQNYKVLSCLSWAVELLFWIC